jgi:hypothetical protein
MVTCKEKKMTKKGLLVLVLAGVLAGGISAQESFFSIGGGILAGYEADSAIVNGPAGYTEGINNELVGFGAWVFADAKYAELSIGLYGGSLICNTSTDAPPLPKTESTLEGSFFAMDFSLLGKYPFVLGKSGISLFPLLGIGYQLVIAGSLEGTDIDTPSDLSALKILLGVGADFALGEKFFIRSSLLGGYRFPSKMQNDFIDAANDTPDLRASYSYGLAFTLKVAFGIKL